MSYADQAGQLRGSLIEAGLPAAAATIIANILGNSVQGTRMSGEVIHDQTPPGMRQVSAFDRTHRLTNIDSREDDAEYRPPLRKASEERKAALPIDTVVSSSSPQQTTSSYRVDGGNYTQIKSSGSSAAVDLRVTGSGDCLFRDEPNNSLVAKTLRAETNAVGVRFFIEQRPDEVVWKLQSVAGDVQTSEAVEIEVVTDVTYAANRGFEFTKKKIWAIASKNPSLPKKVEFLRVEMVSDVLAGDAILKCFTGFDVPSVSYNPMGCKEVIEIGDCPV